VTGAEQLHALAVATRDAALARERAEFDEKWGRFLKCSKCGARLGISRGGDRFGSYENGRLHRDMGPSNECTGTVIDAGYSR
jgi:hypothetical protein